MRKKMLKYQEDYQMFIKNDDLILKSVSSDINDLVSPTKEVIQLNNLIKEGENLDQFVIKDHF